MSDTYNEGLDCLFLEPQQFKSITDALITTSKLPAILATESFIQFNCEEKYLYLALFHIHLKHYPNNCYENYDSSHNDDSQHSSRDDTCVWGHEPGFGRCRVNDVAHAVACRQTRQTLRRLVVAVSVFVQVGVANLCYTHIYSSNTSDLKYN